MIRTARHADGPLTPVHAWSRGRGGSPPSWSWGAPPGARPKRSCGVRSRRRKKRPWGVRKRRLMSGGADNVSKRSLRSANRRQTERRRQRSRPWRKGWHGPRRQRRQEGDDVGAHRRWWRREARDGARHALRRQGRERQGARRKRWAWARATMTDRAYYGIWFTRVFVHRKADATVFVHVKQRRPHAPHNGVLHHADQRRALVDAVRRGRE